MTKRKVPVKKTRAPEVTVYTPHAKGFSFEFPNISRLITERVSQLKPIVVSKVFIGNFFTGVIVMAIVLQGVTFFKTWMQFSSVKQEEAALYQQLGYWQTVTERFSNYRDGYFSLAVLYYRLGNDEKARENIEKALTIDPRFDQGRTFASYLAKSN